MALRATHVVVFLMLKKSFLLATLTSQQGFPPRAISPTGTCSVVALGLFNDES